MKWRNPHNIHAPYDGESLGGKYRYGSILDRVFNPHVHYWLLEEQRRAIQHYHTAVAAKQRNND